MPATSCSAAARRCAPPTPTRPSSSATAPPSKPATPSAARRGRGRSQGARRQELRAHPPGRRIGPALRLGLPARHRRGGHRQPASRSSAATSMLDAPIKTIGLYTVSVIAASRGRGQGDGERRPLAPTRPTPRPAARTSPARSPTAPRSARPPRPCSSRKPRRRTTPDREAWSRTKTDEGRPSGRPFFYGIPTLRTPPVNVSRFRPSCGRPEALY